MFVGDGVEASSLRTACERSDILRGRVRFTGSVPNNRVPAILAEADVVVLPSYSEGLPLVLVEAMAAGLPCIGTRVGGIPEVIIDGYNGILVDPGSPAQIANALGLLVSNEEFRASLARAARDSVETKYDIKRNSLALIELYREVIQP
jgi:glycosyltransferase involved in cell wall biosynthesis